MKDPTDVMGDSFASFAAADKANPDPLVRVMALHALAYCERLFYLEEVEEIRRADANVYDGRRLHEELQREEEAITLELASENLGLKGKLDAIKRHSGAWKDLHQLEHHADSPKITASAAEENLRKIRGHEGRAARAYFALLPHLLKTGSDRFLAFQGRNRRPPKDPVNALLSFGYALLYRDCVAALLAVGLEPALGFLHTPRSAAYPLALDLMELFRLILWEIPLIGSINRRQWQKWHFEVTPAQVWLSKEGRRQAIQLYESRKQDKWKHPVLQYSLSYARTLELEARLLEKEWTGQPGLFAKLRLR